MSIITIVGAGQMGSAMCFPARSNGHEVRLVGTPLDREIIERAKVDRWHLNLKRYLPEGVKYYQIEDMRAALMGADLLIGGVSSFGVGLAEKREGQVGKLHYNSQAALFGQSVKEMRRILKAVGAHEDNIIFGAGDLYVTIYGGRTRMIGTLLGRGMRFEEALAELHGVTLESLVIATRAANAIRHRIERGELRAESFPLLLHCDDVINHDKPAGDIPWDAFEEDWEL